MMERWGEEGRVIERQFVGQAGMEARHVYSFASVSVCLGMKAWGDNGVMVLSEV